jgi:hypothetical protein
MGREGAASLPTQSPHREKEEQNRAEKTKSNS